MPRCEDFPCCGHESGDCPDTKGRFKCVGCGHPLRKGHPSSYCTKCLRRLDKRVQHDMTGQDMEAFGG